MVRWQTKIRRPDTLGIPRRRDGGLPRTRKWPGRQTGVQLKSRCRVPDYPIRDTHDLLLINDRNNINHYLDCRSNSLD